jgi:hypothetical protein
VTFRAAIAAMVLIVMCSTPAATEPARRAPRKSLVEIAADVVRALTDYYAALERARPAYEAQARAAAAAFQERRALHDAGMVDAAAVEAAERAASEAHRALEEHLDALAEARYMAVEASVQERLAKLRPLPPGRYDDGGTSGLVRFAGTARWSVRDVGTLQGAFARAFGRPLPVSALGQSRVHDRLGLDHRNAVDVAVHPDSTEGRWLTAHLRDGGIPFIAVREAIAGSSTGAHVHVGPASPRR